MGKPVRNVTIVGGGTAGWLAALLLNSHQKGKSNPENRLNITLIESPNIPTVGVGEATVPGMPRTLKTAGVSEAEFLKACNASYKLGVSFEDWNRTADGEPISYINPFSRPPAIDGVDISWYFAKYGGAGLDFVQTFSPSVDLMHACHGPRPIGAREYDNTVGFAYHLDAGKFAAMLKDICIKRGVRHVLDDMTKVHQDEDGWITGVELKEKGLHEVEFVIDCTGFRGLIINETLGEEFLSYSDYLANDRAMAVQIPHPGPEKLDSVTRSRALGAGWTWRVPLWNRIGTGYVYSSAHRTDEEARTEFLQSLGDAGKDAEPRVIPMRVGRTRTPWVKNCVAIGLSGGFIEPLESTAIHMIDTGLRWLMDYFPDKEFSPALRDRYNRLICNLYDEVRDFICLHYVLGNRTDSDYWADARALKIPDSLAENLELWKHKLPGPNDLAFASIFPASTYTAVLLGKQVYETGFGNGHPDRGAELDPERWAIYLRNQRERLRRYVQATADHRALLANLRGEDIPPPVPFAAMAAAPAATVPLPGLARGGSAKTGVSARFKLPEFEKDDAGLL